MSETYPTARPHPRATPPSRQRLPAIQTWIAGGLMAVALLLFPAAAAAKPREMRVPLHDGKAQLADVSAALCEGLGITAVRVPGGSLDLNGLKGSNFVAAVDEAMGDGCRVTVTADALVLHVDRKKLPKDCDAALRAVRVFTAAEYADATAVQRKEFGLHLPPEVDPAKPLVVLIHGVDSDRQGWAAMAGLIEGTGRQVAYFNYPGDGPIAESGDLLAKHLTDLHKTYPTLKIDLVCHSMGGLVARYYVEGPAYAGGVDRLFLCGTPNRGSDWARWRLVLEAQEHYHLWRTDPNWSPTWMITDGLGEAGDDLKPKSKFLKRLNAQPRRDGVRYTIIAGDQSAVRSTCADWWDWTARTFVPDLAGGWKGVACGQAKGWIHRRAEAERAKVTDGDGPVKVKNTKLDGVTDFVVVHADHLGLCFGDAPAAWDVIRDRL